MLKSRHQRRIAEALQREYDRLDATCLQRVRDGERQRSAAGNNAERRANR